MDITYSPPERFEPSEGQKTKFLAALSEGHDDVLAALKAGVRTTQVTDVIAAIGPERCEEARAAARLPLAEVKERVNAIMRSANDAEEPMDPKLALDILARRDASWSPNQKIDHTSKGESIRFELTPEVAAASAAMDEAVKKQMRDDA